MSAMIGAICAAGWKGFTQVSIGREDWGVKLPDALIPLGNGETILSRSVRQLREVGATDVYAGVGIPDRYHAWRERWLSLGGYNRDLRFDVQIGATIWTPERLNYVEELDCIAIPIVEFEFAPASFTVGKLLKAILASGKEFDSILVTMADYVWATGFEEILKLQPPCMWCPIGHHQGWYVDRKAAEFLSEWLVGAPPKDSTVLFNIIWDNLQVLEDNGIRIVKEFLPPDSFQEVEFAGNYDSAIRLINLPHEG